MYKPGRLNSLYHVEMASQSQNNNCEPCMFVSLKQVLAEFRCEDCLERYCERCALDHSKFRVLRNHHVCPLEVSSDRDKGYLSVLPSGARQPEDSIERSYYNEDATIDTNLNLNDNGVADFDTGLSSQDDQFDKLSIHSYEDMEGPESSTTVLNIYKEKDTRVTKYRDPPTPTVVGPEAKIFIITVKDTELARRIKEVSNIDIQNLGTTLTIDSRGLTLSAGTNKIVTCDFSIIRRYGTKENRISIELGRGFKYGNGFLKIEYNPVTDLYNAMKEIISKRSR